MKASDIAKVVGVTVGVALGIAGMNNGIHYLVTDHFLDKWEASCQRVQRDLEFLNNKDENIWDNVFMGNYGSRKAYEHYLEDYCKEK